MRAPCGREIPGLHGPLRNIRPKADQASPPTRPRGWPATSAARVHPRGASSRGDASEARFSKLGVLLVEMAGAPLRECREAAEMQSGTYSGKARSKFIPRALLLGC